MKKVLIILGHPDNETFCGALAERYKRGAIQTGVEVQELKLADLQFDPVLRRGYKEIQTLEPDLVRAQELIKWADHLVFVYPIWWGTMPALLKGFIDRVLLPGFAFKYRTDSPLWDKLLTGRTARLIITLDAPAWYNFIFNLNAGQNAMKRTILQFCGIKPVRITNIGAVKQLKPAQLEKWLAHAETLGKELK